MHVVPVIDLKDGVAVHAVAGRRDNYKPLLTPLADGSDPIAIAQGLSALWPFKTLYIADLDAIEGRRRNLESVLAITRALDGVEIWLDDGSVTPEVAEPLLAEPTICVVCGSESMTCVSQLQSMVEQLGSRVILSLDHKQQGYAGPEDLLKRAEGWPERVIAMSLTAVGCADGPDLEWLRTTCRTAKSNSQVFAAGGMRDIADFHSARAAGASGALIASALHTQKLKAGDLNEIAGL